MHVWSVSGFGKGAKIRTAARHRSFALQPANHGPSERFDAPETAGLHAAAASLPSRRGLGDDDRAAGRRHADYEYGLHLNQLDLVTAFAGDRPGGRLATVPSPGATRLSILTSSKRSPLPCRSRRGATVASARSASAVQAGCGFWTTTRWSVTTSTRSPMRSSRTDGRFACGARARRLDAVLDLGHQRQALLKKSSHHGTAPATVGGATNTVRLDPHLLSIELLNGV